MKDDQFRLLTLLGQAPCRLKASEVATVLNCGEHDVAALLKAKLLKPLGHPTPNAVKLFATADVLALAQDRAGLVKVTQTIYAHWQDKNARKKRKPAAAPGLPGPTPPADT